MITSTLVYGTVAGAATLAGISIVLWKHDLALRYSHYINSFAAGVLLTIALLHLIPESVELSENALLIVLVAFLAFYLLEAVLVFHSGSAIHFTDAHARDRHSKGITLFSGLFIHSLIDGIIIATGFEASHALGLFTAIGVILHELPEGVTSFALMMRSMSRKRAFYLSLAVGLATPVGAAVGLGILGFLSESALGIMMAIAGGSFLYVAASDLIPETHERNVLQNMVFLFLGGGIFYLLGMFFE
jgi:ZIP family zinc transporter/zinc and cadmium transporter